MSSSGLSCTVWSLISRRSRARRPTGSLRIAVTSRFARTAPSAIWAAPSAARVSSRSRTSCGFSTLGLASVVGRRRAGSGALGDRSSSDARVGRRLRSSPMASKALLSAGRFQVAGIPWLHWRTAEACFKLEASVSREWARLTVVVGLGLGRGSTGFPVKRQARSSLRARWPRAAWPPLR